MMFSTSYSYHSYASFVRVKGNNINRLPSSLWQSTLLVLQRVRNTLSACSRLHLDFQKNTFVVIGKLAYG